GDSAAGVTALRCSISPESRYLDTVKVRTALHTLNDPCIIFEPKAYHDVIRHLLNQTGSCEIVRGQSFLEIEGDKRERIHAIQLEDGTVHTARFWIDATDGRLCVANEWRYQRGQESRDVYQEPSAPEEEVLNVVPMDISLIFRIRRKETEAVDKLPADIPEDIWWTEELPGLEMVQYPNGDWNCRMFWTMRGEEYQRTPPAAAYQECYRRIRNYWYHLQQRDPEYRQYSICWFGSALEIRDSLRILTEKIVTEHTLLRSADEESEGIAVCDYPDAGNGNVFAIPAGSLLPVGSRNVLIASRSSGFSRIASRVIDSQRVVMQLGQAAGAWVALALRKGTNDLRDVPVDELREELTKQHVQLQAECPDSLSAFMLEEDPLPVQD
ncbi:MAG: FAD-dependent oxidoreductase, partial [Lentisphaerae bacterium]